MEFSKLNGFYLVQNNFLGLCKKLLTTLENQLISSMLVIVLYLFGIFLLCSFFIWNKVSAFLYTNLIQFKKNLCSPLYTVYVIYLVKAVKIILQARNNSIYILHTMPVNPLPDDKILDWF